jgi:uncharacterized protein (TIGR02646 family)
MRHISTAGRAPSADWLKKAGDLLTALNGAPDRDARSAIIDANSAAWGELKDWLLELSHQKCWFSEAKDCFSHWHVEHFRPKKSAKDDDGTEHDGYWWLAFNWKNFRICGSVGNTKKGTFFPLRPMCARVGPHGDIRLEDPQLLDPADEDDPSLLSFDVEGNAIVAPGVTDAWEIARVQYSIERLKLDFGPLADKRKTVWAECWARISEYLHELALYHADKRNPVAKAGYKQAAGKLRSMIREECELSSVARACINASGDPRLIRVLQTA